MFTSDFAADFSGLTIGQIKTLEEKGLLFPIKQGRSKYYGYGDIYILRIFKILRRSGIHYANISAAYEYLKDLRADQPLSSFILLHDKKEVYTVIDGNNIKASRYGQMILKGTLKLIAVGSELEEMRRRMNHYVLDLKRKSKQTHSLKTVSLTQLAKLLA